MKKSGLFISVMLYLFISCNNKKYEKLTADAEVLHQNEKNLTRLIVYDIFSPPVASRIYVYSSLAAHEAMRHENPNENSIVGKLKGFSTMPQPEKNKNYNFSLAASKAFYDVARQLTFSKDTVTKYENETYSSFEKLLDEETYSNSIAFGEAVAKGILKRAASDNYKETRSLEKYFGSEASGKWRPTSPDYLDGAEPYWNRIKPFVMDSANQFDPGPPPVYDENPGSDFYKMAMEVYNVGKNLSQEQKDIAHFWDDNPFVSHHTGHLMFNTKKQTPGGHWMGITTIACRKTNTDAVKTARAYALVAVGLLEGFISCWDTKYKYSYLRPITFINDKVDKKWEPFLQTPSFPEYTSGHSAISASAATILTSMFGENFTFHDDADKEYIGVEKDFTSFMQASLEASISRFYGGIHYRISLDIGVEAGKKVGENVFNACK